MEAGEVTSLRVSLLGELRLTVGDRRIAFPTKKAAALFAVLLLNEERIVPRERLMDILWPNDDEERSRRNLSTCLWRVRRVIGRLGKLSLNASRQGVALECPSGNVDVFRFRNLVARTASARGEELKSLLELAAVTYTGDLLEDMSEEWFEDERRALRSTYLGVLRDLGAIDAQTGNYGEAITRFQMLVRLDPFDEDGHRELMRVYHVAGKRGAALSQFEFLKHLLMKELGSPPAPSTVQLYEHIRTQNTWVLPEESKTPAAALPALSVPFRELPLIGRAREVARMSQQLDQALHGRGTAVLVYGDLGIGKTKLIQTVMEEGRLRGFDVLYGVCPDLATAPPYQVLIQALWPRIRLGSTDNGNVAAVIDLAQGAALSSQLQAGVKASMARADSAVLNEQMLDFLTNSPTQAPTALVLEDIHRVDRATEGFLATLLNRLVSMRLFVVLSARRGERESDRIVASLLAGGVEAIELNPLGEEGVSLLVEAALGHVVPMNRLAQFVYNRTSGVPLFVLELLKFLVAGGYLRRRLDGGYAIDERTMRIEGIRVPSQVLEIVRARIARLEPDARALLSVAAVIGSEIPFELLERLLEIPEDEFIETVENLLESRLLMESERHFRFPHESVRIAALSLLSRARLRKLHSRVAALLEILAPAKVIEIAWHLSEAGDTARAAHFFEVAGDNAGRLHANDDAVRSYSQAIACVQLDAETDTGMLRRLAGLLLKRQEVLDLIGERGSQARDVELLLDIARKLGDESLLGHGLLLRSKVLCRMNENKEALDMATEAERLFRAAGDTVAAARASESLGLAYVNLRNQREARRAFRRSLALFKKACDRAGEARALANLGIVMAFARDNVASADCLNRAEDILLDLGDKRTLAWIRLQKGLLSRYVGQGARSEALLKTGIALMKQIGDKVGEARGRSQLACTWATTGKLREGLREALTAIRLAREANDVRAQILLMNNAAYSNLRAIGEFRRAERYVTGAMRMAADGGRAENAAIYYDTMAAILMEKGDNEGALRWTRQARSLYRKWEGHFKHVEDEIAFHMGLAHMRLGDFDRAVPFLTRSAANWRRSGDLASLVHSVSALGELHLSKGDVGSGLESAREVEKILRRIDGAEQIQRVYWIQYRIYAAAGARVAARRALKKAVTAVSEQAGTLKGRLRRRFLLGIAVNSQIMVEAERHGLIGGVSAAGGALTPRPDPALRIDQRRKAIQALMAQGSVDQRHIADQLGVSIRTIRSDVAALKHAALKTAGVLSESETSPTGN